MIAAAPLLEVSGLRLGVEGSARHPVDGVSFSVRPGEVFGIVGESGSGKTLTTRSVLRLLPPGIRFQEGTIRLEGEDLTALDERRMRSVRGAKVALIPQHAGSSLNPLVPAWRQVAAALGAHGVPSRSHFDRAVELFDQLGIREPAEVARRYPHQLSGGMQQRVVAAASLAAEPALLIADEPTSALDPLIQIQFLRLLHRVQVERGASVVFVTHDLGVVARICDRVAVMYGGRVMEQGPVTEIFGNPRHPYTQGLIGATPQLQAGGGTVPIPGRPPLGAVIGDACPFAPRCGSRMAICGERAPEPAVLGPEHTSACWLHSPAPPAKEEALERVV